MGEFKPLPRLEAAAKFEMTFGPHKGRTLEWILLNAPAYFIWLQANVGNTTLAEKLRDARSRVQQ
jgi:hypothetical protein